MMSFVCNHCRTRGKLVLLATVVVLLLHAATAVNSIATRRSLVGSGDDAVVPSYSPATDGRYNYGRSDISHSHGVQGKGKSSLDKLNKCYETCIDVRNGTDGTDKPTRSPTKSSIAKPPCCKGGVSFLKMIYRGKPGKLFLPSSDFTGPVVNPCSNKTRTSSHGPSHGVSSRSGSVVKFVSCNQCLPNGTDAVSKSCDSVSDSYEVQTDTEVCMAAFNATGTLDLNSKFPTNMYLYFFDKYGANTIETTLHTSCSKPIHSPWAARLDACVDKIEKFYVNLSAVDISSLVDSPVLEFIDGVSVKDPTALLTNCNCSCDATPYPTFASIDSPSAAPVSSRTESSSAAPTDGRDPGRSHLAPFNSPSSIEINSPSSIETESPAELSTSAPTDGRDTGPGAPPGPCEEKCEAYVFENCVLRTSSNDVLLDEPCDVSAAEPGRLLETLQDYHDQIDFHEKMVGMLSVDDQIEFHERMVALLSEFLSHLE